MDVPITYTQPNADDSPRLQSDGTPTPPDIRRAPAIVLSRDCDYDKSNWVIVAEIRPLSEVAPQSQGNVRRYRVLNTFYLAEMTGAMPESYVDFRRIDRVHNSIIRTLVDQDRRIASLTDAWREALQDQIALFFGYTVSDDQDTP